MFADFVHGAAPAHGLALEIGTARGLVARRISARSRAAVLVSGVAPLTNDAAVRRDLGAVPRAVAVIAAAIRIAATGVASTATSRRLIEAHFAALAPADAVVRATVFVVIAVRVVEAAR